MQTLDQKNIKNVLPNVKMLSTKITKIKMAIKVY